MSERRRRHVLRNGHESTDRRRRRKNSSSILKVLLQLVIYGAVLVAFLLVAWRLEGQEQTGTYGSMDGRFESHIAMEYEGKVVRYRENEILNYLLIGIDKQEIGSSGHQDGGQADFLIMLSIDRKNRTVTPLMIDRDTMASVSTYGIFGHPAGTRTMQICLAQAFSGNDVSGSQNTAQAVSSLLKGVKVDRYLLMDIGGIAVLNDAVGGVTVTLEDDLTALDPTLKKGATVLLEGEMAEHFVRGRTTVADGTNVSRMSRQRTYLKALMQTLYEKMDQDSTFLGGVLDRLSGHLETDTSKSVLLNDVNAYYGYEWQELRMLPGTHRLGADGFMQFWPDKRESTDMIVDIWFE